ncbi:hypothetical protein LCGC14_1736900 [marine sediment metagenome]|uniref:Uncharacterized protein n=1 Tax=marine sediment metagenome TaxID=412755 RepID=A0A0F9H7W2_9ZZZZ
MFTSILSVGRAVPPSWVGVNTGDSFTWSITVQRDTAITIATDLGLGANITAFSITDLFGAEEEVRLKVNVLSISSVVTVNDTQYVNVSCSLSIILPGTTTLEDITEFGNLIVKYVPNNYTLQFGFLEGMVDIGAIGGLFIPTDINWTEVVAEVNAMSSYLPGNFSGLAFTALADGVQGTLSSQTIDVPTIGNVTLAAIVVLVTYTDNGVLNTAEITYGGADLLTIDLTSGTGGEVPSYEVSIVLITTLVASIGIIYFIKKKKRLGREM